MTDILERAKSWDRCWPGNLNIEMLVDDMQKEIKRLRAVSGTDALSKWMIENSFVTGHGDTIEDLLGELKVQIKELKEKAWMYDSLCK